MALKDVIAPELWKDFGLDENGDPVDCAGSWGTIDTLSEEATS